MANRFWVGGTGTWDTTNTANWSATSGGAGGVSVPVSIDAVYFDANSGGGTVTLGADGACGIINLAAFTGVVDFVNTYKIVCASGGTTIVSAGTGGIFSNGPRFDLTFSGGSGTRTISAAQAEAFVASFYITAGTDTISGIGGAKTVNFTGFAGTWAGNSVVRGDLIISTGMTITSSANNIWFAATSGTQKITTNGKLFDCLVNFGFANAGLATYELQDNMTVGSTRASTLWNGTLNLNNLTLSTGLFVGIGTRTRSITFGTGNITTTGSGTVWNTATLTGFSRTGTPTVNISNNSATAATVSTGAMTAAQALDFNYTTGTYTLTDTASVYRSVNFTGFAGTIPNSVRTIFGSLTLSTGMTLTAGANATTFSSTSAGNTITSAGKTQDYPIIFNGVGGVWACQDALTQGSTRAFTFTNGAVELKDSVTSTVGAFATSGTSQKFLRSTTAGKQATISQASGNVSASYLSISDINATGGANWVARTDLGSKDITNNTGWNFIFIAVQQILKPIMAKILQPIILN
jgi:hypothetical protein